MCPGKRPRLDPLHAVALSLWALCAGCERPVSAQTVASAEPAAVAAPAPRPPPPPPAAPAPAPRDRVTLLAGGDVSFGRRLGQLLLRDATHDPFASVSALLASADLRFANLECQLSDQHGETQSKTHSLVFTGPPEGAGALARGRISIVSVANNHMWDYGQSAFFETLDRLDRAGVAHAGGGRSREAAYAPVVVEHEGFRVAVLAVTDIWNQGRLSQHPARDYVAGAELDRLAAAVRAAKGDPTIGAVIVSYHGGEEHLDMPVTRTREIARAAIDAGADVFLGHHPHVIQGVELRSGRPIFYSLGNFLMGMNDSHPETAIGMLARIVLRRGGPPSLEVCPFRMAGLVPIPLAGDTERPVREALFAQRYRRVSAYLAEAASLGPFGADGCAPLRSGKRD